MMETKVALALDCNTKISANIPKLYLINLRPLDALGELETTLPKSAPGLKFSRIALTEPSAPWMSEVGVAP